MHNTDFCGQFLYVFRAYAHDWYLRGMCGPDASGGNSKRQRLPENYIDHHNDTRVTFCGGDSQKIYVSLSVSECEPGAL